MVVNKTSAETFPVRPTAHSPNSTRPVIVYRGALVDRTPEGANEAIELSEWVQGGHWKISKESLAAIPHYHSNTHEAYTVLKGTGTYRLGKSSLDPETDTDGNPVGVEFTAHPGDVFVFPAGVTHYVTDVADDYEIIGWYSLNDSNTREQPWDYEEALDSVEVTNQKRAKCEAVPSARPCQRRFMTRSMEKKGQCQQLFGSRTEMCRLSNN
ncbi:hypothetical protein FDECE_17376 [Fusarium decemcellulare]|nr:hypothetical protein FDECE_17376 [Fusarium decemcellulare]